MSSLVLLMNSVTIVGFVGADPEQRQARNNGSRFTVLSVATQRSWKTRKTNGSRKSSGIEVFYFFGRDSGGIIPATR